MNLEHKDDGGSAFPGIVERPAGGVPGMSLRDYFAAIAMQALIMRGTFDGERDTLAANAYGHADFMLKERAK